MAPHDTVQKLAERIRQLETSFRLSEPLRIPLTSGLDAIFPEEGLSAGSLVELLPSEPGVGAWTLALILARHACGERKTLLIADPECCFYPPAARRFGLDPERTVIIRPRRVGDALLALGQALRCPAIGAGIGAFERLNDRDGRRLQLAAEAGGSIGVLVRPLSALHTPSFASVRLRLDPLPSARGWRRLKLEVLRWRHSSAVGQAASLPGTKEQAGSLLHVEIDDATGHVRLFSPLEPAAHLASPA